MFELADRLVGIYKTHDHTKSVTINPKLFQSQSPGPVVSANNNTNTNNNRAGKENATANTTVSPFES